MKKKFLYSLFVLAGTSLFLSQCKKATEEDKALFNKSKDATGFTYYKNDITVLPSSSGSPHNSFFRVRFNAAAQAALTDNGKLPVGNSFPDGSLIVKELYDSQSGNLALLAAGWLWAEFKPDGKAAYSTSKKGEGCISCHNLSGNRDYARLFELFP
ncbi:MAG: hypothetical protein V4615_10715 [Bacteroidota bacterium]